MKEPVLRVTEIFYSLQGEASTIGLPTVFIRLTGCPLRCSYCDTDYAFQGGELLSVAEVLTQTKAHKATYVTVTGGEPLAQSECKQLLTLLCDEGLQVSLETSGALPITDIDERVSIVMDLKTPSSNESERNLYSNIDLLQAKDQLKFVIGSREDYLWAREKLQEYHLADKVDELLFSPCFGEIKTSDLADWILQDGLPVRFQLQLHKLLWNDEQGR